MNGKERKRYAAKYRNLYPYERREKAFKKIGEACALLEDEIDIQAAYNQMDFSTLKTSHYKWAVKCLKIAMEALHYEQDESIWKLLHEEGEPRYE